VLYLYIWHLIEITETEIVEEETGVGLDPDLLFRPEDDQPLAGVTEVTAGL